MATASEQTKSAPLRVLGRPAGWGRAIVGIALVLAGAGAIVVSSSYDEPKKAAAVGSNIPVNLGARNTLDLSAHNSPTLITNPRNLANLIVANRIDSPRYSCALNVSFDGGASWTQTPIPAPVGEEPKCFAPDAAFGPDGTLYLSYGTLKGRANAPNATWIASSTDGGRTLSEPHRALRKLAFQVRLTADPSRRGRIYLTYLQASEVGLYKFSETGNPIQAIRSDDGGASWSAPTRVSDGGRERAIAPSPAIAKDGELYVLYLDLGDDALDYEGAHRGRGGEPYDGRWQLVLSRSRDRGITWKESTVDRQIVPTERFIAFTPPFPSVAVDDDSGRVYASFQDARNGDADVLVWSLERNGSDWEGPKRVNDTARRDNTWQYLPKVAVAPDGRLDVVYLDRRGDRNNVMTDVSYQHSFDQGESFAKRIRLTDRPFDSRVGFGSERGLPDLGSRLGLVSTDSRAMAVWTDTRAGTRASSKQDLAERVVAFNDPPRLSGTLEALFRWGGVLLGLIGLLLLVTWALGQRPGAAAAGSEV